MAFRNGRELGKAGGRGVVARYIRSVDEAGIVAAAAAAASEDSLPFNQRFDFTSAPLSLAPGKETSTDMHWHCIGRGIR